MADQSLSLEELRQGCQLLERALVETGEATTAELDGARPGSTDYPALTADGWLRYYGFLWAKRGAATPLSSPTGEAALAETMMAALAETPEDVVLESGETLAIYPKSPHAFWWLESLDAQLREVARAVTAAAADETPDGDKILAIAPLMKSLALRLFVWILSHPGPELPFDDAGPAPEPPDQFKRLGYSDIFAIFQAHNRVNKTRAEILALAFPSDEKTSARLPFAGFIAAVAAENGIQARVMLRRWSLGAIWAQVTAAGEAAREGKRRAEAARPAG
jgi:hypothetical protein